MNLKKILLHVFISSSLLWQTLCNESKSLSILSPTSNSRIMAGSTVTVKWQKNKKSSALLNVSLHSNACWSILLASNVKSRAGYASFQLPMALMQGEYMIKLVNKKNVPLASSGCLYLTASSSDAIQATQRIFTSPPSSPCTQETGSSLQPSRKTTIIRTTNTSESLTLTSAQVATVALSIVVCSSFILAVYIWGSFLLQKKRQQLQDEAAALSPIQGVIHT